MNTRQVEIFLDLLRHNEMPISLFISKYSVTQRTIRQDIHEINHLLDNCGGNIITSDSIAYFVSGEEPETVLNAVLNENQDIFSFSVDARHQIEAFVILIYSDLRFSEDLGDIVGVSVGTVLKDLKFVEALFKKEGVLFCIKQRKGFKITSPSEKRIRTAFDILNRFSRENIVAYSFLSNMLNNDIERKTIRSIIRSQENCDDLSLTDESFEILVDYVMVVCSFKMNASDFGKSSKSLIDATSQSQHHTDRFYDLAYRIVREVSFIYNIRFRDGEVNELAVIVRNSTFLHNPTRDGNFELQMIVSASIYDIFAELNMREYLEYDSYITILHHVTTMVERIEEGIILENPFVDDIKVIYSDIFRVVKNRFKPLEESLNLKLNDSEISFIVVHVISIVENNQIMNSLVLVMIVGVPSKSLYQLMKNRIQQLLGVKVVGVQSLHNYERNKNSKKLRETADLIVTTENITNDYLPVIRVSPLVKGEDISEINKFVMLTRQKRKQTKHVQIVENIKEYVDRVRSILDIKENQASMNKMLRDNYDRMISEHRVESQKMLSEVMTIQDIRLDVDVTTWDGAITMSGQILAKQGKVTEKYIESMIQNVIKNGPYIMFTPHVAVAHTSVEDGALQVGCSVIRPKDNIKFGHETHDPCKLIFCLSVVDKEEQLQIFFNLMRIVSNEEVVKMLVNARDEIEFLEIIKVSEMRIGEVYEYIE